MFHLPEVTGLCSMGGVARQLRLQQCASCESSCRFAVGMGLVKGASSSIFAACAALQVVPAPNCSEAFGAIKDSEPEAGLHRSRALTSRRTVSEPSNTGIPNALQPASFGFRAWDASRPHDTEPVLKRTSMLKIKLICMYVSRRGSAHVVFFGVFLGVDVSCWPSYEDSRRLFQFEQLAAAAFHARE